MAELVSRRTNTPSGVQTVAESHPPTTTPSLSAEVYLIPLDSDTHYLVYAPLRRAAFVANAALVNLINDLKEGTYQAKHDPGGQALGFLRRVEIADAGTEEKPILQYENDPQPTSVTLLLTTACNLRCTYCYASAGDTPSRLFLLKTSYTLNFLTLLPR